jgi:cobalt-zinc-cadmium resistance protein CzcA
MARPWIPGAVAATLLGASVWLASTMGLEFVPQLQEGDVVVQTERLPSISPEKALTEATRIEKILKQFPEVERVASRSGAPAVATDPMGMEESDIIVQLKPRTEWVTAETQPELVEAFDERLSEEVPGAKLNFTQPIDMRFNEMLEGITGDVGVKVFGPKLDKLLEISDRVAERLEGIEGAADVTPPSMEGVPNYEVTLKPEQLARYGVSSEQVRQVVAGIQRGTPVGTVRRGQFRDPVVTKLDYPRRYPVGQIPVTTPDGGSVPLQRVADIERVESPAIVEREGGSRRFIVEANVRGRDLGGFVQEARRVVG